MKKIFSILTVLLGLFLLSCEPNEEILDEYEEQKGEVNEAFDYTFTADDYATASGFALEDAQTTADSSVASSIEDMEAYNNTYDEVDYVPPVLGELFPGLGEKSVAKVTFNKYVGGLDYLNKFSTAETYELVSADYDAMGEGPGKYDNFSSSDPPEEYLPEFLAGKYPDAVENDMKLIVYKYYAGYVSTREGYYMYDGSAWAPVENVYVLTTDDYDSMGEGIGEPGEYNNFSGSASPDFYIPRFLKENFAYAQEGDFRAIVYKYYSGGVSTRADEYHYNGSEWVKYDAIETYTKQFIHNGEKWVFDPTITIEMSKDDYQIIVDYVLAELGEEWLPYGNTEVYYGASAYYGNFDLREGKWNKEVFETWEDAAAEALALGFLPAKVPDATKTKFGVDMYYKVQFDTYDGSDATWVMTFRVTEEGNPAAFEFVEGPERL